MNKQIRQTVLPIITAIIWGTAFVFQGTAAEEVPAFTFNFARSLIAVAFLSILSLCVDKYKDKKLIPREPTDFKRLLLGGSLCGICLFAASNFQQYGITMGTSSGKAGFITAIYMVIIPIIGLFFKKRVKVVIWVAVLLSLVGLYLLCIGDGFSVQTSDVYVFICALCFAAHILVIDHFSSSLDGIKMSAVQFFVVALLSGICALIFERGGFAGIKNCVFEIVYMGLFSSGIAYTLQIISQKGTNPTVVSVLLSLESFFAVVAEAIIRHVAMSFREYAGCAIILIAVMITQIDFKRKGDKSDAENAGR